MNVVEGKEKMEKPVISHPSDFQHTMHIGYDPHTGEFTVIHISHAETGRRLKTLIYNNNKN